MNIVRVKIKNWEKYQKRQTDIKRPFWFSFANDFLEDPVIWGLSDAEKIAWIYILCQASKQGKQDPLINFDQAARSANVQKRSIESVIKKLEENQIVIAARPDGGREAAVGRPWGGGAAASTLQNKTEQEKTNSAFFLFDELHREYKVLSPVKGPHAESRFREQIKTQSDFDDLKKAIANYKKFLAHPDNKWRKPKQSFEAFLGTKSSGYFWRDFINLAPLQKPTYENEAW